MCLFVIEKINQRKHFSIKEKFCLVFRKVFFFYFERKVLFRSCEIFRNIMLFVDYIKYWSLNFWLLYILFWIFFFLQFHPLEFDLIWFLYQLWSSFLWLLFAFSYYFLIKNFYLSNLVLIIFYFIWNNL